MSNARVTRITVRIPTAIRNRLKEEAKRAGMRESDLVRDALEQRLSAAEGAVRALDRMKRAGLIGIVRDAPPDLSSNRDYFDGFGSH